MNNEELFKKLLSFSVNDKIKTKQKMKYLSWTYAWSTFKKEAPDANYEVLNSSDGLPYFEPKFGIMVRTEVTVNSETLSMWLPVMDGANRALKSERYSYLVKEYVNRQPTGKMTEKWVAAATMMDINKAIMRCLVKNIAMFGLGLYIFSNEDMPEMELINSSQMSEISNLISKYELMLSDLHAVFGINNLRELAAYNFDSALKWIDENKSKD